MSRLKTHPDPKLGTPKKLLFSAVVFIFVFGAAEGLLWVAGTNTLIEREDPFRGFSGRVSVYSREAEHYRTRRANTNTFNDQSFLVEKPPEGYRIFGLGGSSAFGFPWGAGAAFTSIVGDVLEEDYPARSIEAVNASGTSYAMHRLNLVADELLQYEPDLFLIYSGHNEFIEPAYFESLKNRSTVQTGLEYLLAHTRLYSVARQVFDGFQREPPVLELGIDVRRDETRTYSEAEKVEIAETYQSGLTRLVRRARAAGVEVILITVPANLSRWRPKASIRPDGATPEETERWSASFLRGRRLLQARKPQSAATALEAAVNVFPQHAETLFEFALALEGSGRFEEAAEAFERAADADASPIRRTRAINAAIRNVAQQERIALVDADRIFREASSNGLVGFELVEDYVHPNERGHALIAWHVIREIESRGFAGASREANRAQFDRVVGQRDVSSAPKNATWFFNTGVVLSEQGRFLEAIENYRKALEIRSAYPAALMNLGLLLVRTGQDLEAIEPLSALLELDPTQVGAYLNLGNAKQNLGRFEEAIAHYERALLLKPDLAFAHNNLANALQSLNRYAEAETHYVEAIRIRPDYANAYHNWGNSLLRQDRVDEAISRYKEAIRIQPDHAGARRELAAAQGAGDAAGPP